MPEWGHNTKVLRLSGGQKVSVNPGFSGHPVGRLAMVCSHEKPDRRIAGRENGQPFMFRSREPDTCATLSCPDPHLGSDEDRDAAVHVEFEAAVGVHVVPEATTVAEEQQHDGEADVHRSGRPGRGRPGSSGRRLPLGFLRP